MDIQLIGLIAVIIVIVIVVVYFMFIKREKFQNETKVIKYFGANFCPYSNKESMSYKVMQDLKDKYNSDIEIKYYWTDGDGAEEGKKYNVEYVPTILNSKDEPIQLALPEGTNTKDMSNNELKEMLLTTVFGKI